VRPKSGYVAMLILLAAGSAGAQAYKWVDADGKVGYGDTPPPGAQVSAVRPPQASAAKSTPAPGATDAKKGALTPAEQDMAFRRRQADAGKKTEQAEADLRAKAQRDESCERTRQYLMTLESGQRVMRTDATGERYYLDDDQVAQEIAKEKKTYQASCK